MQDWQGHFHSYFWLWARIRAVAICSQTGTQTSLSIKAHFRPGIQNSKLQVLGFRMHSFDWALVVQHDLHNFAGLRRVLQPWSTYSFHLVVALWSFVCATIAVGTYLIKLEQTNIFTWRCFHGVSSGLTGDYNNWFCQSSYHQKLTHLISGLPKTRLTRLSGRIKNRWENTNNTGKKNSIGEIL